MEQQIARIDAAHNRIDGLERDVRRLSEGQERLVTSQAELITKMTQNHSEMKDLHAGMKDFITARTTITVGKVSQYLQFVIYIGGALGVIAYGINYVNNSQRAHYQPIQTYSEPQTRKPRQSYVDYDRRIATMEGKINRVLGYEDWKATSLKENSK